MYRTLYAHRCGPSCRQACSLSQCARGKTAHCCGRRATVHLEVRAVHWRQAPANARQPLLSTTLAAANRNAWRCPAEEIWRESFALAGGSSGAWRCLYCTLASGRLVWRMHNQLSDKPSAQRTMSEYQQTFHMLSTEEDWSVDQPFTIQSTRLCCCGV